MEVQAKLSKEGQGTLSQDHETFLLTSCDTSNLFPNDEHKGMDDKQVEEHEQATKLKTINYIHLGFKFKISTWYYSPYPGEF